MVSPSASGSDPARRLWRVLRRAGYPICDQSDRTCLRVVHDVSASSILQVEHPVPVWQIGEHEAAPKADVRPDAQWNDVQIGRTEGRPRQAVGRVGRRARPDRPPDGEGPSRPPGRHTAGGASRDSRSWRSIRTATSSSTTSGRMQPTSRDDSAGVLLGLQEPGNRGMARMRSSRDRLLLVVRAMGRTRIGSRLPDRQPCNSSARRPPVARASSAATANSMVGRRRPVSMAATVDGLHLVRRRQSLLGHLGTGSGGLQCPHPHFDVHPYLSGKYVTALSSKPWHPPLSAPLRPGWMTRGPAGGGDVPATGSCVRAAPVIPRPGRPSSTGRRSAMFRVHQGQERGPVVRRVNLRSRRSRLGLQTTQATGTAHRRQGSVFHHEPDVPEASI